MEQIRRKREICYALLLEIEHNVRVIYRSHTPVALVTASFSKFQDQFWSLPPEISERLHRIYSMIGEENDLIGVLDDSAFFRRNDLWMNLRTELPKQEEELRKYDAALNIQTPAITSEAGNMNKDALWDVFICHAGEDKNEIARPLAEVLRSKGLKVWFDEFTLTLGDSLSRSIDYGLANSRFGAVILSPSFFNKEWPRRELDGLTAIEISYGKTILPIWHNVNRKYILQYSPILADKLGVSTKSGLDKVVDEILKAINKSGGQSIDRGSFVTERKFRKILTRRKFIVGAIGTAVVVAAAGYPYLQKSNPTQTLQTTTTSLNSGSQNLVINGGFEDGMSRWNMGTGATPSTAYVTSAIVHSGTSSLRLQSNEGVYQDLPATSLSRRMTLSYLVYFERQVDLIPSSFVGLYTPDNSISRIFVVTRFPNSKSLTDQMSNLPNAVFRQFDIPFEQWIPIIIDVSDFFTAAERTRFPLTRIGLESSNSNGLYYDDVKILLL